MIHRLRRKLIAITAVLLTAMLLVILICLYQVTSAGLREDSVAQLQSAEDELMEHMRPGEPTRPVRNHCFVLELRPDGTFVAVGSSMFDLSDKEELLALLEKANATGQHTGVLKDAQLRFLELDRNRYAFMDISAEKETLYRLNVTCLTIFIIGTLGFIGVSVLLARWAVRPVEQAWNQQRQFVADASHELKTPLTVILTNAELLNAPEYDAQSKERFSENILTMSRQMRGLVEELLDQARVDNGGIPTQAPLNFSKLVEEAILPFEPVYFEAGKFLESHIQPDLTVAGSAEHLRRVVEILLDNGCKYSTTLSPVAIRLTKQGRTCLLSVTSPGVPLTEEQCQDIFKRFYRADPARAMNRSYGLGLPIAERIVEQHRGKIWAQSHDRWNTFFVSLPLT